MRVVAGRLRGRALSAPAGDATRPTGARVKEALFSILGDVSGLRVLDLYAGSGALGFEAASRGAQSVTMVDMATPVVRQLEDIKAKLKADNVQILRGDALVVAQSAAARGQKYDLIFLDPPYQQEFLERNLPLCTRLLKQGGLVYAESGAALAWPDGATPDWMAGWEVIRADKAGMVFYHLLQATVTAKI